MKKQQLKTKWSFKRTFLSSIHLAFIAACIISCNTDTFDEPKKTSVDNNMMSIENAQNILSNLTNVDRVNTKGSGLISIANVSTNELDWQTATENRLDDRDQVEVSFSRKSTELIAINKNPFSIDTSYVTQKLIFHRNNVLYPNSATVYTMSLIPDKSYREKHPNDISHIFNNFYDIGDFSGYVLFNDYQTGNLQEVAKYIDGRLVFISSLSYVDIATYERNLKLIKETIGDIRIFRKSATTKQGYDYLMDVVNIYGGDNGKNIGPNWGGNRDGAMANYHDNISGSGNIGGGGGGGGSIYTEAENALTINKFINDVKNGLDKIGINIFAQKNVKLTITVVDNLGYDAGLDVPKNATDYYNKDVSISLHLKINSKIIPDSDLYKAVVFHEISHLKTLFDVRNNTPQSEHSKEAKDAYKVVAENTNTSLINQNEHNYFSEIQSLRRELLNKIFPGANEWMIWGGLNDNPGFQRLPRSDQKKIDEYVKNYERNGVKK